MSFSRALFNSSKDDWQTPDHVRSLIQSFADPLSVFDPCPGPNPVGEAGSGDGLKIQWPSSDTYTVFSNPPYGNVIRHWVQKASIEAESGSEILMLVPARTDTVWFHDAIQTAQGVCFIRGRLKFRGAANAAPFPSIIIYWGARWQEFRGHFRILGNSISTKEVCP